MNQTFRPFEAIRFESEALWHDATEWSAEVTVRGARFVARLVDARLTVEPEDPDDPTADPDDLAIVRAWAESRVLKLPADWIARHESAAIARARVEAAAEF